LSKDRLPSDYAVFLAAIKDRIALARTRAIRAAFHEGVLLYWDIGPQIASKQRGAAWGDSVVERLAADLRASLPDTRGFSADNLWRARQFFSEYTAAEFLEQLVPETAQPHPILEQVVPETQSSRNSSTKAKAPKILEQPVQELQLRNFLEILKKIKETTARLYYLRATAQLGWTRGFNKIIRTTVATS
jgi:hypothetical protein